MHTVLIWAITAFVAISAQKVSTNGRCGLGFSNRVCKGSSYGDCCSQYGWCGSTSGHCGTGCRPNFGTCSGSGVSSTIPFVTFQTSTIRNTRSSSIAPSSTRTSSTVIASPSVQASKNARCGYSNDAKGGFTCKGSAYGDCCSQYSYCGSTSAYCGTGCQPGFGTCSGISSSVRSSSTSLVRSSSTSSVRSSIASSSAQSSSASSSIIPVSSSTQASSSAASSSTTTSLLLSTIVLSSSIDLSTSTLLSATSPSAISSSPPSSTSVPSPSATFTNSASSTLVLGSVTSSLASGSPSLSSSVATTVSSQTVIDVISTSVAETVTSVVSTQPSSTPAVISPTQIVANPSFELGDGSDPTDWTLQRLYIIDADATGRVQSNPQTGSYSIRGRGQSNGGYDALLSQTVTVVPGASYNIEVFAKQTTAGYCSISVYFGNRSILEYARPGTSYTSISAVINIPAGDPVQQTLFVDGACSLPDQNPEMFDLFIDDVTMTLVV